ncbi:hypothetical protein [Vibrio mimicus]|uniref:hypothetical protein n=1 Tax=Vibrio mimicus TaxID=674 RepID=UPI0011D816D5|nr:hypothetical protein [Vibrio mimicus]TXY10353.1 hypothetical protein FXE99_10815 [Vibrio mimicus]BCN22353.1 hypothetical protein [Vibrio mimicus]BCN22512.1 hypothetical protein [Vibrio mimicus]
MKNAIIPDPIKQLDEIISKLLNKTPFTFVRFSDGETEIIRNRFLEINQGKTVFRGRIFDNKFPNFDKKKFDPKSDQKVRRDLLESAAFRKPGFIKGVPSSHNDALIDRELFVRLNGGITPEISFADLFLNSNYTRYKSEVVPLFGTYEKIYVIANYRAKLVGELSGGKVISIPDNFFATYSEVKGEVINAIKEIESGSLVLSSASSLSNIVGYELAKIRDDITFIDVGTSINNLLSLDGNTRCYHDGNQSIVKRIKNKIFKGYNIKW